MQASTGPAFGATFVDRHFTRAFLKDGYGNSPHPLQRQGSVTNRSFPNIPAGSVPGLMAAPPARSTYLMRPAIMNNDTPLSLFKPARV